MPKYKKMYLMLNDVVTDTIYALQRMQRLVEKEAAADPDGPQPPLTENPEAGE